jgi:lipid II isoglutaminyl synthase (glutamine-hydrolysing)
LKRGIIGKFIKESSFTGKVNYTHAIFEIEEATMPRIINELNPTMIVITNLYRDQLDAYGEVDRTQKFLSDSIKLVPNTTVILNADDPRVSILTDGLQNETIYYGMQEKFINNFSYEGKQVSKKNKTIEAKDLKINDDLTSNFKINIDTFHLDSPGKFHIYNALAAIAAANELRIDNKIISKGINNSKSAFGRGELIKKDDINYKILLVKNPVGLSLTLDLLLNVKNPNLVFILNDNIADGRDVSWIWDANFELLQQIKPNSIICSGTRAEDMLLRVKYALEGLKKINTNEYKSTKFNTNVTFVKDINRLHNELKTQNSKLNTAFVLPTYTAMLEFRKNILGQALNE